MGATKIEALVRGGIEAWNADDWDALEALHAVDVEVVAPEGWPESGVFRGWTDARRQYEQVKGPWSRERLELEQVEIAGERALASTRWVAHGEASGIDLDTALWVVYDFDGARIARLRYFLDEQAARAAADG